VTGLDIAIADLGSCVAHDGQVFLHMNTVVFARTARVMQGLNVVLPMVSTHLAQVDMVEFLRLYAWADIPVLHDVVKVARLQVRVHRRHGARLVVHPNRVRFTSRSGGGVCPSALRA